jgi:6-phosphogluconate dehydrogenase
LRHANILKEKDIKFIDVAVSGGPSGARNGACLMVGGETSDVARILPLLKVIAAPKAYAHLGSVGAGHFAKMVHNGIEYGMMQAIAEGAAVLEKSPYDYDLAKVFALYNKNSVIQSRLVGWTQEALAENPTLEGVSSVIAHSGEGEWTINTAEELGVAVPVIETSFQVRLESEKQPENFRNKIVTAQRGKFGGHSTKR